jgi:Ca2+-binding RTX toxin-like protein
VKVEGAGDINGTNELLLGSAGNDTFHASAGRDTLRGNGGNGGEDALDFGSLGGASGRLLVDASGKLHGFAWTDATVGSSTTFSSGISTVRFADAEISFSAAGPAAKVDQLYHLFHNGADPVGLAYWADVIADGDASVGDITATSWPTTRP